MRTLRAVFSFCSSRSEQNSSRTARAAGLNCGRRCHVHSASTRMLAHDRLGFVADDGPRIPRFAGACPHRTAIATSTRSERDPHHDAGLSPSDADPISARPTRIIAPCGQATWWRHRVGGSYSGCDQGPTQTSCVEAIWNNDVAPRERATWR